MSFDVHMTADIRKTLRCANEDAPSGYRWVVESFDAARTPAVPTYALLGLFEMPVARISAHPDGSWVPAWAGGRTMGRAFQPAALGLALGWVNRQIG